VRNGDPEANSGTSPCLPFLDRFEYHGVVAVPTVRHVTAKLGDDPGLVACCDRNDDLVRREKLAQEHGLSWDGMESNLYRYYF
jgi:hypothetical protein